MQVRLKILVAAPQVTPQGVVSLHPVQAPSTGQSTSPQSSVFDASPTQLAPLCCGVGLSHALLRVLIAVPQVTPQGAVSLHSLHPPSIGHGSSPQSSVLVSSPVQGAPEKAGAGESHCLEKLRERVPQVPGQGDVKTHSDQAPSTEQSASLHGSVLVLWPGQSEPK